MKTITKVLMASFLAIFVLGAFTIKSIAPPEIVTIAKPMIEMSKTHTLEVLDAMPEDKFNYQPNDVNKTFAGQMVHIGYTMKYFRDAFIMGEQVKYEEPDASTMSKAEIRSLVEAGYDSFSGAINGLSEAQIKAELPFGPDKTISRGQSIFFALDHATNHRAKANLYLRMNDIEPPNYKFM